MEKLDLTPTWTGILQLLLRGYAEGSPESQSLAKKELEQMAYLADLYVSSQKREM